MALEPIEIDYSNIPQETITNLSDDWDAPRHVYFGKKDERGKQEKEPVYVHQEYPRLVYAKPEDKIIAKLVASEQQFKELGEGWEKTPAAFGYISAPSWEDMQAAAEPDEKDALVARAKELGVPRVSHIWGVDKLKDSIALAEKAAA